MTQQDDLVDLWKWRALWSYHSSPFCPSIHQLDIFLRSISLVLSFLFMNSAYFDIWKLALFYQKYIMPLDGQKGPQNSVFCIFSKKLVFDFPGKNSKRKFLQFLTSHRKSHFRLTSNSWVKVQNAVEQPDCRIDRYWFFTLHDCLFEKVPWKLCKSCVSQRVMAFKLSCLLLLGFIGM